MSVVFDHDTTLVTREPNRSLLPFVTVLTMAGAFRALATPEANAGPTPALLPQISPACTSYH